MAIVMREHEPLAAHTVFKIGGPAERFAAVGTADELERAVADAMERGAPWRILGAGSNVLVADSGFPGVIIHQAGGRIDVRDARVTVEAGVAMSRLVAESLRRGLRGFEWAIGVPGSVGGSARGNAGCFGGEMKDVVESVEVFDAARGRRAVLSAGELEFGYRESVFKRRPELVILALEIRLRRGDPAEGTGLVRGFTAERVRGQDLGSQSAGCVFKNIRWDRPDIRREPLLAAVPELAPFGSGPGVPAGFLIDQAGLKGRRAGGAMISGRHANFIVNAGAATANDVCTLINSAKDAVRRRYGLSLEEEIQYLGFEDSVAERKPQAMRKAV